MAASMSVSVSARVAAAPQARLRPPAARRGPAHCRGAFNTPKTSPSAPSVSTTTVDGKSRGRAAARRRVVVGSANSEADNASDASVGYPEVAWGWDKADPPKSSLSTLTPPLKPQAQTAKPWILNLVEFVHWAPAVPAVLASYTVLAHADFWLQRTGGSQAALFLLILGPIVAYCGSLPGITMHTYEVGRCRLTVSNPVYGGQGGSLVPPHTR